MIHALMRAVRDDLLEAHKAILQPITEKERKTIVASLEYRIGQLTRALDKASA